MCTVNIKVSHCVFTISTCTTGAIAATGSYTERSLPVHIIDLNCTGNERNYLECPHNNLSDLHSCDHTQDASLRCQGLSVYSLHLCDCIATCFTGIGIVSSTCSDGDVRLIGGSTDYEGRVEVCINRVWGTVCQSTSHRSWINRWNSQDANILCRQLGHQDLGELFQCIYSVVICCQIHFTLLAGSVVFTNIGFSFGEGTGPVFLADLWCSGSETNLLECPHTVFVGTYCTHSRDVGVRCEGEGEGDSMHVLQQSICHIHDISECSKVLVATKSR